MIFCSTNFNNIRFELKVEVNKPFDILFCGFGAVHGFCLGMRLIGPKVMAHLVSCDEGSADQAARHSDGV